MFVSLFLIACSSEDSYDTASGSEPMGTWSFEDTGEEIAQDTAGDTGTEITDEEVIHNLEVNYTSTWSSAGPFYAGAGETVDLGAFMFTSTDGTQIEVQDFTPTLFVSANPLDRTYPYSEGEDGDVVGTTYVPLCQLREVITEVVYMGPIAPSADGSIPFTDDFRTPEPNENCESITVLQVECAISAEVREELYGVAVDVETSFKVTAVAFDGNPVEVSITATNGAEYPRVTAIISADE